MLAEYLQSIDSAVGAVWTTVMPGVDACRFSMGQTVPQYPVTLTARLAPMHFEAFFCCSGALHLHMNQGGQRTVCNQDILLLSSCDDIFSAEIAAPLQGILISVNAARAGSSLEALRSLLGGAPLDVSHIRQQMHDRQGCALLQRTPWTRTVFMAMDSLPGIEQSRYCVLKTGEILYLLCVRSPLLEEGADVNHPDSYIARAIIDAQAYMEGHLEEKLTIEALSRRFHLSPTAFKSCFRRLCGQPVHRWLQCRRIRRAADLLRSTPMTVLQIAQSVGYEGVSQFNVAFKRQYGITPRQYRKMSDSGDFNPFQ